MRRLALSLALLGYIVPGTLFALGLGEIEVDSALNEPLKASIELVGASPSELNSLRVKLASPEAFAQVGLDRPFYLTELQFKPVVQDGAASIEVTTKQSVREPFLDFLVEVSWSSGRLLREYTVLLDPPLFVDQGRQVQTEAPVVAPAPAAAAVARPERTAPARAAAPAPTQPAEMGRLPSPAPSYRPETAAGEGISVQSGDTLWSLATRNRPDADITVEQMMMALLRANPEAFGNDNINDLKKGYVLRVPGRDEIEGMSRSAAFDAVQEQHALWREYRARLAGEAMPQQMATDTVEPSTAGAGPTGAEEAGGRLDIVGAGGEAASAESTVIAQADTAALEEELAVARQTLEARRQESEELQARVSELEQILTDKDRLLMLKDEELADLQARLGEQAAETPTEVPAAEPEPTASAPVVEESVQETVTEQPEQPVSETVGEPVSEEAAAVVVEETTESEQPPAEETAQPTPTPPSVRPPAPPAAAEPPAQPSFLEDLTSRPNFLAVAGIGAILVLLVVVLIVRRMRKSGEAEEVEAFEDAGLEAPEEGSGAPMIGMGEEAEEAFEPIGAEARAEPRELAGGEADVEPVPAAAGPGPAAAFDEEIESDDTTAEADVYLAYGLHQQAEELLKGALASKPDKNVYRLKLLETYFATKDQSSFGATAQELHDRLGDAKGLMWSRAVAMGQEISPDNPLFSGTDVAGLTPSDFAPKRPESADIDFSLGDELEPSPDLDIGLDESEQPTGELPTNLDFGADLDRGQGPAAAESADTATAPQPGGVEETAEIEFDLSELEVGGLEEPKQADESTDLNVEFGNEPETAETRSPDAYESETEEIELAPTSETMELDVTDLDLSSATQETQELEAGIEGLGMEEEEGLIAGGDEVSTKLDLAKAYIDMGDAEGARSTLEEVIAEGNEEQRREAEELMSQIA